MTLSLDLLRELVRLVHGRVDLATDLLLRGPQRGYEVAEVDSSDDE